MPPKARGRSRHATSPARAGAQQGKCPESPRPARHSAGERSSESRRSAFATNKQLSFVPISVGRLDEVIDDDVQLASFRKQFWNGLLCEQPAVEFQPVQNMTLRFWIAVYNKWAEMRLDGRAKVTIDGHQLTNLMNMPWGAAFGVVRLFDREGAARIDRDGTTKASLEKVNVNILELMMAGVLTTKMAGSLQKMRFLFCLWDDDDTGVLEEKEFAMFVKSFYKAFSAIFRLDFTQAPATKEIISMTRDIFKAVRLHTAKKHGSMSEDKVGLDYADFKQWYEDSAMETDTQGLSLPFKLMQRRFCATRYGDAPDIFDESLSDFVLSWRNPKRLPDLPRCSVHGKNTAMCTILTRVETIMAKEYFRQIEGESEGGSVENMLSEYGASSTKQNAAFLNIVRQSLSAMCEDGKRIDFVTFLRVLAPCSQPRHLKMYEAWCKQHDRFIDGLRRMEKVNGAYEVYSENASKPLLPVDMVRTFEKQFESLDRGNKGYVTHEDLMLLWGWDEEMIQLALADHDLDQDCQLDLHEFMRMMCPQNYRVPDSAGSLGGRGLFSKWIETEFSETEKWSSDGKKYFYAKGPGKESIDRAGVPLGMLPELSEALLREWNRVFDEIDRNTDGKVSLPELKASGFLPPEICDIVTETIDACSKEEFGRQAFLLAMAHVHGVRLPSDALERCISDGRFRYGKEGDD